MAENKKPWRKIVKDKNYVDVIQRDNLDKAGSLFDSIIGKIDQVIDILQKSDRKDGKSN